MLRDKISSAITCTEIEEEKEEEDHLEFQRLHFCHLSSASTSHSQLGKGLRKGQGCPRPISRRVRRTQSTDGLDPNLFFYQFSPAHQMFAKMANIPLVSPRVSLHKALTGLW